MCGKRESPGVCYATKGSITSQTIIAMPNALDEYCLLSIQHWSTCLQKSEWANWMQAIGSVAAILFALYLPKFQERRAREALQKSVILRSRTLAGSVDAVLDTLLEQRSSWKKGAEHLRVALEEAHRNAQSIQSELLDLRWIMAIEGTRGIALQMAVVLKHFMEGRDLSLQHPGIANTEDTIALGILVAEYKTKLAPHIDVIRTQYKKLDPYKE